MVKAFASAGDAFLKAGGMVTADSCLALHQLQGSPGQLFLGVVSPD
ncbi:hypothetical protein [Pedobacter aquatilis]|nr:hypothetical protein [Pedobacter aquatilis]